MFRETLRTGSEGEKPREKNRDNRQTGINKELLLLVNYIEDDSLEIVTARQGHSLPLFFPDAMILF